jgi:hypothetical protein
MPTALSRPNYWASSYPNIIAVNVSSLFRSYTKYQYFYDFSSYKYCLRDELRKKTHNTPTRKENTCVPTFKCKYLLAHAHTPHNNHVTNTYAGMNGVKCGQQGLDVG